MSLNRMFLRVAAIAALSKGVHDEGPPTMAENRVYDSRIDPIEHANENTELPLIAVYTDDDEAELLDNAASTGRYGRTVVLRVEIAIGSFDTVVEDDVTFLRYALPVTDAQLEAKLDIMEQQVRWALLHKPWRPETAKFLNFVKGVRQIGSVAQRDSSGNNKLSARFLNFSVMIPDDCPPSISPVPVSPPGSLLFGDFPGASWLGDMLEAIAQANPNDDVIKALSDPVLSAVYLPLLRRIGVSVDAVDPAADPNRLATLGKTQGPDGRDELKALWEIKT